MNAKMIFFNNAKNSICERTMNEYLLLDKNEVLPARLSMHIISCKKCRTEIHYLSLAERLAAEPLKQRELKNRKPVTMTQWVVCGILMTILLLVFGIASQNRGTGLQIGFYLVFGVVLCSYCAIFVAKNLDYFVKKIDKNLKQPSSFL